MADSIRRQRKLVSILLALLVLFGIAGSGEVFAATVKTIPNSSNIVASSGKLDLSKSNYRAIWNGVNHKVKTGPDGELCFCVPIRNVNASWTIRNFLTLEFSNVGTISGRRIDCRVAVTSMTVTARKGSSADEASDGYMGVCSLYDASSGLEFGSTIARGNGYRAKKTIDYTVTLYYHDTGETVDLPFFQTVRDLDTWSTYNQEAWESVRGFTGTYYKYPESYNVYSGNKVSAPEDAEVVSGRDSLVRAGLYAPTTGGTFSARFYEGNCGTFLHLYSQYAEVPSVFIPPVKAVDQERVREGEPVTYEITHTMGTFFKNTLEVYDRLVFTDVLPERLHYETARLLDGSGQDITDAGTLEYEEETRTLRFTMGDAWVSDTGNYNGQKLRLVVETTAENPGDTAELSVINEARLAYEDGLVYTTNPVETVIWQDVQIRIRKELRGDLDGLDWAHGEPVFLFRVTSGSGDVRYRSVRFTREAYEAAASGEVFTDETGWTFRVSDGHVTATSPVETVPFDTYSTEEVPVSRFELMDSQATTEGRLTTFGFVNAKDNWKEFGHNDLVINSLTGGEGQ